ncbi:hypothetical protein H257_16271 [Aphanomyces astaci]|uniref:Uncharacterized protein n=1 Tax=Aphanomyces astaci TaxID=112090 RepID=W4FJ81_APHAT|nr:hypothetical protein H257_16271 [Aphanomyces astaci]ETV67540.1 hypothetical protein H257_16271 [Aphanomyces astaci]|eukprot:XP_009842944.1 hypothetical protein H257_16271 [Aphanomyces astaci]
MTQGSEGKREAPATCSERTDQRLTECKSISHQIRECPGITPEVIKQLLRAHGSTFERGRSGEKEAPGAPGGRVAMEETDVPDAKRPELPTIVACFLRYWLRELPENTVMCPMELRPYGADSQVITVTKQVRLGSLEFKTTCGPLMLRGLLVCVDETVAPVELTLGLPVMQKLGYNEYTLLKNARWQDAVWDFGEQTITTPGVAMHRTLWMGALSDGIDDDEGMACATPEHGNAPDGDGPVRIVLEAKVAEASVAGMPIAAVEQLRDVFRLKFGKDPPVKVEPLMLLKEGVAGEVGTAALPSHPYGVIGKACPGAGRSGSGVPQH